MDDSERAGNVARVNDGVLDPATGSSLRKLRSGIIDSYEIPHRSSSHRIMSATEERGRHSHSFRAAARPFVRSPSFSLFHSFYLSFPLTLGVARAGIKRSVLSTRRAATFAHGCYIPHSLSGDRYGVVGASDTSTLSRRAGPLQRRRGS